MPAAPALSARAAREAHATSELTRDLVHVLVERQRPVPDPFTLAWRRYRTLGDPAELGGAWRQLRVDVRALALLRRLDRDLLDAVAPRAIPLAPALVPATVMALTRPRTTYVVAGPFDTAAAVDALTEAILETPGVRSASVTLDDEGMALVEVLDAGTTPLAERMGRRVLGLAPLVMAGVPSPRALTAAVPGAAA